ncbi:hypothetical protein PIB30_043376 [Stylosanthes scabra]|uniref:Mediator complex subunit 15 KIX domain-containing protein n=1 Tax=Stylosanthes scabra TaxID=79078 RepID=A0ABU6YCX3_9FABA|nr:hypothetical protein [Stylosanthes scabra]
MFEEQTLNSSVMDAATSNWRNQLEPQTRKLLLQHIITKLKFGHLPGDYDDDLELRKIAQSIEQKSYAGATTQADYFDKIASKILLLEKAREREWRYQLRPDSRQRIVNKIPVDTPSNKQLLWHNIRHLASIRCKALGLLKEVRIYYPLFPKKTIHKGSQLRRIAQCFEEKIFTIASNQSDYLRKISLKMLTIETRYRHSHGPLSNQLCLYHERANPGIVTQPQVHNPGQQHHIPLHMQPHQHHHLSQNIENNID